MKKLFCIIALTSGCAWAADQGNRSLIKSVDLSKVNVVPKRAWTYKDGYVELTNALHCLTTYKFDLQRDGEKLRQIAKAALLAHKDAQEAVMAEVQQRLRLLDGINDQKEGDKQDKDSDSEQEEGQSK